MFKQNLTSALDIVNRANSNEKAVVATPTMLTPQEQMLLYLLAKEYYSGEGAIFDAGICLGGCTESFARGLAARATLPSVSPIIHAYELGIADEDYVTQFIQNSFGETRHKGDSFVDIIQKNLDSMPCKERIQFFPGDICEKPYPEKIEIMFLDVCKLQNINFVMQKLFSRLIPGKSIVIQQDYVHAWHPYIHTTMGYLSEYFEPIGSTWYSTISFILKKAIPDDILGIDVYNEYSVDQLESYIKKYYSYFNNQQRNHLETTRAFFLYQKGEFERSYNLLNQLQCSATHWDFKHTSDYLCKKMGFPPFELIDQQHEGEASCDADTNKSTGSIQTLKDYIKQIPFVGKLLTAAWRALKKN